MLSESWIWLEEWRVHGPVMESGVRALCNTTSHHFITQHQTSQHNTKHHIITPNNTTQHQTSLHTTTPNITPQHQTSQHNTTSHQTSCNNTTRHDTTRNKTKQVKIPIQTIRYQRCYTDTDVKMQLQLHIQTDTSSSSPISNVIWSSLSTRSNSLGIAG